MSDHDQDAVNDDEERVSDEEAALAAALAQSLDGKEASREAEFEQELSLARMVQQRAHFELSALQLSQGKQNFEHLVQLNARQNLGRAQNGAQTSSRRRRYFWWLLAPVPALLGGLITLQLSSPASVDSLASENEPLAAPGAIAPPNQASSAIVTPASLVAAQSALLDQRIKGQTDQALAKRLEEELKMYREQLLARLDTP